MIIDPLILGPREKNNWDQLGEVKEGVLLNTNIVSVLNFPSSTVVCAYIWEMYLFLEGISWST